MASIGQSTAIMRPPSGREPNYITAGAPDGALADTNQNEIEIETGISIADRVVLRILGWYVNGFANEVHNVGAGGGGTAATATDLLELLLNTQPGGFDINDPECIMQLDGLRTIVSDGTNAAGGFTDFEQSGPPEMGELVASPRLILRTDNQLGGSVGDNALAVRIGYEFERITRDVLIELLEKHADVFIA